MRPATTNPLLLLLLWACSSLAAPIPISDSDCIDYASCRPSLRPPQWPSSIQSKESSPLREPHFPAHQLKSSKQTDTVEVRLLEHHTRTPQFVMQSETPMKNRKLDASIQATHRDKALSQQSVHELGPNLPQEVEQVLSMSHKPSPNDLVEKQYGFTAEMLKKVQLVSIVGGPKCSKGDSMSNAEGRMIITYTYGYHYIRTDYTSVLVVSIVVIFFMIIVAVELLDKAFNTGSRTLFGLDQGAIRLEEGDCEHCGTCPPYSNTTKSIQVEPASPPSYESLQGQILQEVKEEEKIPMVVEAEFV